MTSEATDRAIRRMLDVDVSIDEIIAGLEEGYGCSRAEAIGKVLSAIEDEEDEKIELEKKAKKAEPANEPTQPQRRMWSDKREE